MTEQDDPTASAPPTRLRTTVPDSYAPQGRIYRLFERPEREWSIEDADGVAVGTLIASDPETGDPEWYVVSERRPEPDGYWPTWRRALNDFLETLD